MNSIKPKDLKARLDSGEAITVIDVREDWEVAKAALPFAVHIPMNDIIDRIDEVPTDGPVVIMCKSGGRSARVVEYLNSTGYTNLTNLDGGITGWAADVDPTLPEFYS